MRFLKQFRGSFLIVLALATAVRGQQTATAKDGATAQRNFLGFDANEYPGDNLLPALRQHFSFTGYWLTNPPGADHNSWTGKRAILVRNGFGFLVAANGRLDNEILQWQSSGKKAAELGGQD